MSLNVNGLDLLQIYKIKFKRIGKEQYDIRKASSLFFFLLIVECVDHQIRLRKIYMPYVRYLLMILIP